MLSLSAESRAIESRAIDLAFETSGVVERLAQGYLVRSYANGVFLVTEDGITTLVERVSP